jgi:hypothetical protein
MKVYEFIEKIKSLKGVHIDTDIAFIFKEEDGQYRHCHTMKDIFMADSHSINLDNTIIIELQK